LVTTGHPTLDFPEFEEFSLRNIYTVLQERSLGEEYMQSEAAGPRYPAPNLTRTAWLLFI
jgi:hypothetical protein